MEGVLRSSKLSLSRTRPEKERISKNGTSGEDSAVANSVGVRLMPWLTGHHLPSAIAGSNPPGGFERSQQSRRPPGSAGYWAAGTGPAMRRVSSGKRPTAARGRPNFGSH